MGFDFKERNMLLAKQPVTPDPLKVWFRLKTSRIFLFLCLLGFSLFSAVAADSLLITEFMAANNNTLNDDNGDSSDWIEIYNPGTNTVSLNGWYLTDSPTNLTMWRFPNVSLLPN